MADQVAFEADTIELLESGCALIVGLVTSAAAPFATRGWGLTIDPAGGSARLLVTAADVAALDPAESLVGRALAVTGCDIKTLRSLQLKGPVVSVEAPTALDEATADRYCDAYFGTVAEVDNIPRHMMDRTRARDVVAVTFRVTQSYDQSPGPGAGAALGAGQR